MGRGRVAVAILSMDERELVRLRGGELCLEFPAEVFGVLCRDVSSLKPRPDGK